MQGTQGIQGIQGVQGTPGPTAVSADAGNVAVLGTDLKIYVPTPPAGGGTGSDEVTIQSSLPSDPLLELWVDPSISPASVSVSHASLTGLTADDHLQYYNQSRGDARYVKKAGDVMTGALTLSGPPVNNNDAVRLIDLNGLQGRSIIAGNGLTGGGTLYADRTLNVGAGLGIAVAADLVAIDRATTDTWYLAKTMLTASTAAASGVAPAGAVWVQY